jgi:hypothetical protein
MPRLLKANTLRVEGAAQMAGAFVTALVTTKAPDLASTLHGAPARILAEKAKFPVPFVLAVPRRVPLAVSLIATVIPLFQPVPSTLRTDVPAFHVADVIDAESASPAKRAIIMHVIMKQVEWQPPTFLFLAPIIKPPREMVTFPKK